MIALWHLEYAIVQFSGNALCVPCQMNKVVYSLYVCLTLQQMTSEQFWFSIFYFNQTYKDFKFVS